MGSTTETRTKTREVSEDTSTGGGEASRVSFTSEQCTMSSMWADDRMKPWNPVKT